MTEKLILILKNMFIGVLIIVLVAILLGFRPVLITGKSMEPAISKNDVVIIRKTPYFQLGVGDIVVYRRNNTETMIAHRIIHMENGKIITKGESELAMADEAVTYDELCGKVILVMPAFGHMLNIMFSPEVMLCIILIIITCFLSLNTGKNQRYKQYKMR